MSKRASVAGLDLEIFECGEGRPLLFLHPGEGLWPDRPWFELLSKRYRVIAPCHPGCGTSALPDCSAASATSPISIWILPPTSVSRTRCSSAHAWRLDRRRDAVRSRRAFHASCWSTRSASRSAAATTATSPTSTPCRARLYELAWADPAKGEVDFTSCRTELAAIARSREAYTSSAGSPTCTIRRCGAGCIASISRPCCSGAPTTGLSHRPMAKAAPEIPGARIEISRGRPLPALGAAGRVRRLSEIRRAWPNAARPAGEPHARLVLLRDSLPSGLDAASSAARCGSSCPIASSTRGRPPTCSTAISTSGRSATRSASTSWSTSITAPRPA